MVRFIDDLGYIEANSMVAAPAEHPRSEFVPFATLARFALANMRGVYRSTPALTGSYLMLPLDITLNAGMGSPYDFVARTPGDPDSREWTEVVNILLLTAAPITAGQLAAIPGTEDRVLAATIVLPPRRMPPPPAAVVVPPPPAAVVVPPPPAAVVVPPPPDDDDGGAARRRRLRRFVPGPRDPVAVLLAFPRGADDFPRLPPGGERGAAPVIVIIPAGGGAEPPLAATRAAFLAAARRREGVNYPVYVLEAPGPTAAPAPTLLEAVQARLRVAVPGAAPPQAAGWPAGQGARLLRLAVVGTGPAAQVVTTVVDLA